MVPYETTAGEKVFDLPDLAEILEIRDFTEPKFVLLVPKNGAMFVFDDDKLDEKGLFNAERMHAWATSNILRVDIDQTEAFLKDVDLNTSSEEQKERSEEEKSHIETLRSGLKVMKSMLDASEDRY